MTNAPALITENGLPLYRCTEQTEAGAAREVAALGQHFGLVRKQFSDRAPAFYFYDSRIA